MPMTNRASNWLTARALDVEVADNLGLYSGKRGAGEAMVIPTFRGDAVINLKFRLFDGGTKDPEQRWANEGETAFWNENVLLDASLDTQPLIITEGHWDAMAAIQCGFLRAVSVPNGAPEKRAADKELPESRYEFVRALVPVLSAERFPVIILATDSDPAGQQLLHDLSVILGRFRCKFLSYGEGAKDLNDVLVRDGSAGVVRCLGAAKWVTMPGLYQFSAMPPMSPETIYEIGSEERGMRLLADRYKMRLGDFTVVTGVPGFGKTSFVNDVCCRVADHYGLRVAWASFEQNAQRDMRRNLTKWYNSRGSDFIFEPGGVDAWLDEHHVVILPEEDDDVTLDWLLDAMEGAVARYGCRLVVIDPWNEIDHQRGNGSETDYVGQAIRKLKRFAKRFQVHIILVAHPAKLQKENGKYNMPSLYDIAGSANFYNKCDIGIVVHRQSKDETIIKIQKVRYHGVIGRPGEIAVEYDGTTGRFIETEKLS